MSLYWKPTISLAISKSHLDKFISVTPDLESMAQNKTDKVLKTAIATVCSQHLTEFPLSLRGNTDLDARLL
jgi:hypothetical protein